MSERWDVLTLGILRYALALPLVYFLAAASLGWRRPPLRPDGISLARLVALGGFGLAGFAVLFIVAIAHMDPGTAAVIAAMSPVTSGLVALFYGERPSSRLAFAVLLSVGGASLAALNLDADAALFEFRGGEPLFFFAQALWAWYSIGCRRAMPSAVPTVVSFATMVPAAAMLLACWLIAKALGMLPPWPSVIPVSDYYFIALLGFGNVALALVFWNFGVGRLGLLASALHMNLIPLFAVLTAYALGSDPRWEQILGGLVVIAGVVQAQLAVFLARRRKAD